MEPNISHSEIISNFANSIKDKSNFDSVKIQGCNYFYKNHKEKIRYDVGNLMLASHDFSNGDLVDSINRLEYIIKNEPGFHSAHHIYIQALIKLNLNCKKIDAIKNAIKHHPEDPLFLNLFGKDLLFNGEKFKALKFLEKSVQKNPHECSFWLDLGFCYFITRNLQMTKLCLSTAQQIKPNHKRYLIILALLLQEESRYKEAEQTFKKAIKLYPDDDDIIVDMAIFYLRVGKKITGYNLYNKISFSKRINLYKLIDTKKINKNNNHIKEIQDLEDLSKLHITKRKSYKILVFMEQGFGDVINFFRYLPCLERMGHSITTIVPKDSIISLLKCSFGSEKIKFIKKINYKDISNFDLKTIALNLPYILDTVNKPPAPNKFNFKKLEKNKVALINKLKKLKSDGKVVGVSWKGNKKHIYDESRSINLKLFSKLFKNKKITFLIIDKEVSSKDSNFLKKFSNVLLCDNLIKNWIDTAIIVSRLDKVITVDTSLAHISGALGVPTKILISKVPDWRWGLKEKKTEWYKSVELIRQDKNGDWKSIINCLASGL